MAAYLADAAGPVNLFMDLRLTHERFGSSSNPALNGHLHCAAPADVDKLLNEAAADKIRDYRADYNNRRSKSISYMPVVSRTYGRLHCEIVSILFLQGSPGNLPFFAAT